MNTANFGPEPEFNFQATPLMVDGVLYSTAGLRRAVIAADAGTGELLWMHRLDEGERAEVAPRRRSGRGLAYRDNGGDGEIFYVTPGYRLIGSECEDRRAACPSFGEDGIVDLMQNMDQDIDPLSGEIGLHATPLVAGDTIVVGAAHVPGGRPRSMRNTKGYIRGFDADTGERKWIFHTIPGADEFGNDTWLNESWRYTGNTGVWGQISVDLEEGIVYLPTEMPTNDYYGGHRHGDNLYSDSLVAVDIETGDRLWHFQFIHHDVWDWDLPCAPILADVMIDGELRKIVAQPSKQSWLYVFDRVTGEPIWPIEEREVEPSNVPGELLALTQPYVTKPPAYDRQGVDLDDLIDLTPELRRRAEEIASRHLMGPIFTPPTVSEADGVYGTLMLPSQAGGTNWPGGIARPRDRHHLPVHVHADGLARPGQRSGALGHELHPRARRGHLGSRGVADHRGDPDRQAAVGTHHRDRPQGGGDPLAGPAWRDAGQHPQPSSARGRRHPAHGAHRAGGDAQHADDGDRRARRARSPRPSGEVGAMLRAYDKMSGEELGAVYMPAGVTGSPMTYLHEGRQYIVTAIGGAGFPGELIAYRLPEE